VAAFSGVGLKLLVAASKSSREQATHSGLARSPTSRRMKGILRRGSPVVKLPKKAVWILWDSKPAPVNSMVLMQKTV